MESRGDYFDGQSSARQPVTLRLQGAELQISSEQLKLTVPLSSLRLSAPLGQVGRAVYLQDGAKCEIRNAAFAAALEKKLGKGGFFRQVHRWESSLKLATLALLLTGLVVWAFIRFGIPVLAERMAQAIPVTAEVSMGEEAFALLDRSLFSATGLPEWRQQEVTGLFAEILAGLEQDQRNYRLMFRDSAALGANALALPGGTVVVTDGLLELVERDEELIAVLAHEIGHIRGRHALRQIIQDSTAGLLIATLTGDIVSSTSLAAALPTMLVDAKFSRDMEREADAVATAYLQQAGIPLQHFADILQALQEAASGSPATTDNSSALDYLSTHPATRERIERLAELD